MFNGLKLRWRHVKSIGKVWWLMVVAAWGAFWAADEVIAKWGSPSTKATWDKYTLHFPLDWKIGLIVLLALLVLLLIEGSFQHHQKTVGGPGILGEYDPKVYLEPLNSEFFTTGMIPFDIFNNGQRVNIAHRIKVQPISLLPSVTFEYVNHLEMNQHKRMLPIIGDAAPLENRNILSALERAFHGQAGDDFPFEITINYEDVTGHKKFATTVGLVYSPLQHVLAANHALAAQRRECKIIELVSMDVRRLS
jgi:hypothetical protein